VQAIPERRIARAARRKRSRTLVCLVGVQTSQFPRAMDLARRFRARGIPVLIGGFHVSGVLAMFPDTPPHLQALMSTGVTLVKGEVEDTWGTILRHAAAGRLAPLYASNRKPDLRHAPVPRLHTSVLRRFIYRRFGTIDMSRGCPFTCSFCTIIHVHGRRTRSRDATLVAEAIETNYRAAGTCHYFFTDDNFSRNPNWRAIFRQLIRLREECGVPVRFLMQVDLIAHRIPDFARLAKRAGCFQVFLGLESLNPASLRDAAKRQNPVREYAHLIDVWHEAGLLTHVGYIIGFPHDDPESVRADIRALKQDIHPDIASFFMLTPLPGSVDYRLMTEADASLDDDLNRYDTFHPVVDHPRMTREAWSTLYQEAWQDFYSFEYMRKRLTHAPREHYVTLLQMYLWYKSATSTEHFHPMMTGFLRVKPRRDRRPGHDVEGPLRHLKRRIPEVCTTLAGYRRVLSEIQALWLATHADGAPSARGRCRGWIEFMRETFGSSAVRSEAGGGTEREVSDSTRDTADAEGGEYNHDPREARVNERVAHALVNRIDVHRDNLFFESRRDRHPCSLADSTKRIYHR
jgi:radical SAM superfamily enzyme YgiQ (UPF0313 family)